MDHHVYFWLKDEFKNAAALTAFEQGLDDLLAIETAAGGRWATPAPVMPRPVVDQSWDYALDIRFATVADHDDYQVDSRHQDFVDTFKSHWAKVLVMDLA